MSWLNSFKQSTAVRLVSSAAKEFFEESTSEVIDPIAEFQNAQAKILDLENRIVDYKTEIRVSQEKIESLTSKVESLQLQIMHNQEEHDSQLVEKEEQIRALMARVQAQRGEPEGECFFSKNQIDKSVIEVSSRHSTYPVEIQEGSGIGSMNQTASSLPLLKNQNAIESLRKELEQCRENRCQEIAAIQEANAHHVARLKERLSQLQSATGALSKLVTYEDASTQIDFSSEEEDGPMPTDENNQFNLDEDGTSIDSRFARLSDALLSAVSLLPSPSSSDFPIDWPPMQPEAQVAVLIAAEAASRRELMLNRDALVSAAAYIDKLRSTSTHADSLGHDGCTNTDLVYTECISLSEARQRAVQAVEEARQNSADGYALLETTVTAFTKLINGNGTTEEFVKISNHLVETEPSYGLMVDALHAFYDSASQLEIFLQQVCSQLEASENVTATLRGNPTAMRLQELLSNRSKSLRESSRNRDSQVGEIDQVIGEQFTRLSEEVASESELCQALEILLVDLDSNSSSFDPRSYNLDAQSYDIVSRLANVVLKRKDHIIVTLLQGGSIETLRNRLEVIQMGELPLEIQLSVQTLSQFSKAFDDERNNANELRGCLEEIISHIKAGKEMIAINTHISNAHSASLVKEIVEFISSNNAHPSGEISSIINDNSSLQTLSQEDVHTQICSSVDASTADTGIELRNYIIELLDLKDPSIVALSPVNHAVAKRLSVIVAQSREFKSSFLVDLARSVTEGLQDESLGEIKERLLSLEGDGERALSECLLKLLEDHLTAKSNLKQAEKDKFALGQLVRDKHAESQSYHSQLQKLLSDQRESVDACKYENETGKLMAKIQQLQSHLLQTEDNYTKEALAAEMREASLRNTLIQTESRLVSLQEFAGSADEQIVCVREERDSAREACRTIQSELSGLKVSHDNLQKALEALERERQLEANVKARHFQLENERLHREISKLTEHVKVLEVGAACQDELRCANQALTRQLERHANRLADAHAQARRYEERIQGLNNELKQVTVELDGKLDKSVMKSLLIGCMKLPPAKRLEAFRSLGSVLDFTVEDYNLLGFNEPIAKNWKDLFWNSPIRPNETKSENENSFVEMLANFLERESSIPSQIRLPTDYLQSHVEPSSNQRQILSSPSAVESGISIRTKVDSMPGQSKKHAIRSTPKNPLISGLSQSKLNTQ